VIGEITITNLLRFRVFHNHHLYLGDLVLLVFPMAANEN